MPGHASTAWAIRRANCSAFILAESFGLAAVGALVGVGGAWALFTFGDVSKMTGGLFPSFEVTLKIVGIGTLVAAALGIIASIMPSLAVARMSWWKELQITRLDRIWRQDAAVTGTLEARRYR